MIRGVLASIFALCLLSAGAQADLDVTASPYNAQCDGVTDDTAAIQAAIVDAAATPTGDVVQLPADQCVISGLEMMTRVTLQGVGPQSILTAMPGADGPWISLAAPDVNHTVVRDLYVDGNKWNGAGPDNTGTCISYVNSEQHKDIRQAEFFGFHGDPQHRILNVYVFNCSGAGIDLWTREAILDGFYISRSKEGLRLRGSDNWVSNGSINWIAERGAIIEGGNNKISMVKFWYIGTNPNFAEGDAILIRSDRNILVPIEVQDTSRYAINLVGAEHNRIDLLADNIANLYLAQGIGYPHEGGHHVLNFDKAAGGASYNNVTLTVANRSAPTGIRAFVTFFPRSINNRVILSGDLEDLAEGGVAARRAERTPGNLVMFGNGFE